MARVLVVDARRTVAEALAVRLTDEEDFSFAAAVTSVERAVVALGQLEPHVAVVALALAGESGLDVLHAISEHHPAVRCVLLADGYDGAATAAALRLGARAVVSMREPTSRLVDVVRGVLCGETHVPPWVLTDVIQELVTEREPSEWSARVNRLTERELEVLRHMVAGEDRVCTAEALYLSVNTVRTHVKNVLAKLEVHSTLEAVSVALRAGIRPPVASTSGASSA